MSLDLQQERQEAHNLIDLLPPAQPRAVRNLLEEILGEDMETSPAEGKAIAEADEWTKHNKPIAHEQVLAEFGLSMADWQKMVREP